MRAYSSKRVQAGSIAHLLLSRVLPERSRNRTGARTYRSSGRSRNARSRSRYWQRQSTGGQLEPNCFRCVKQDSPVGGKYVAGLEFNRACFCNRVQCSGVMADKLVREESAYGARFHRWERSIGPSTCVRARLPPQRGQVIKRYVKTPANDEKGPRSPASPAVARVP